MSDSATAVRAVPAATYDVPGPGELAMSCSVGAASYLAGDTLTGLLRRADQAMHEPKLTELDSGEHPAVNRATARRRPPPPPAEDGTTGTGRPGAG